MISALLLGLLIGAYVGNIIVTLGLALYESIWVMFICRNSEGSGILMAWQGFKWDWFDCTLDAEDYTFFFCFIECFAGAIALIMLIVLLMTGIFWYILGITGVIFGARYLHDKFVG